jgi:hypothetical protein
MLTVRQEAEREAEIDVAADQVAEGEAQREKAIIALCVHQYFLDDARRNHLRLTQELETLQGGE